MRKNVLIGVAAILLAPAFPARADPVAQTGAQPNVAPQPARSRDRADDPERQICVSEQLTASRMPRRVCRTAREWQLLHGSDSD